MTKSEFEPSPFYDVICNYDVTKGEQTNKQTAKETILHITGAEVQYMNL